MHPTPEQYLQGACFPREVPPALDPYVPADQNPAHEYRFRSWLFFTSYFDGDLKDYLREFSSFLGKDVDRVWGNCEGYPEGGSLDFEAFWQYAKRYQITTDAFFNACPGMTVPKVYQLKVFKERFAAFVRATRRRTARQSRASEIFSTGSSWRTKRLRLISQLSAVRTMRIRVPARRS